MADRNPLHRGPQRQAVPRMLLFLVALVVIAVAVLVWYSLGR